MKNVILIWFCLLSVISFAQTNEIDPPSFSEVEKHFTKSKKTVESLAFNDGFKDIKDWKYSYPNKKGTPARSKQNDDCSSALYDMRKPWIVYPNDLLTYTFYTKSPEFNGQTFHYRIRVTYSRSSNGNCGSGMRSKYVFDSSIAKRTRIDGVTADDKAFVDVLSNRANENNLLIMNEYITSKGWFYEGFTKIDSIVIKKTTSRGQRYRTGTHDVYKDCWVYGEIAQYDDFVCINAIKGFAVYKVGLDAYKNNNTFIYSSMVGKPNVIDSLKAANYPSFQIVGDLREYGATMQEVQNGPVLSPSLILSRPVLQELHDFIREECLANPWKVVSKNEKLIELFVDPDDLLEIWQGYNEIKNGLWEISNVESHYDVNLHKSDLDRNDGSSQSSYRISRELSKEQRKEIKGKVGKTSYSESRYKQSGALVFRFGYRVEDGKLKIRFAKAESAGLLKLTID